MHRKNSPLSSWFAPAFELLIAALLYLLDQIRKVHFDIYPHLPNAFSAKVVFVDVIHAHELNILQIASDYIFF